MNGRTIRVLLPLLFAVFLSETASATLCNPKHIDPEHRTEARGVKDQAFAAGEYAGGTDYNAMVIGCNRHRDSNGGRIDQFVRSDGQFAGLLPPRLVRGFITYLGFAPMPFGYRLERLTRTWQLTAILQFTFPTAKFPNRLDIPMELASQLGIDTTICATTQTKIGGIDRGFIQITNHDIAHSACRVNRNEEFAGVPITTHLMEFWRDAIEFYWTRDGFQVRVLIVNLDEIPADELAAYSTAIDYGDPATLSRQLAHPSVIWKVRLNHNVDSRAMYVATFYKPHPLYAGMSGGTIVHEFGHSMGLDDEYPSKNNPPDFRECHRLSHLEGGTNRNYCMCTMPDMKAWRFKRESAKGVYPWIVTRRYAIGIETNLEPMVSQETPTPVSDTGQPLEPADEPPSPLLAHFPFDGDPSPGEVFSENLGATPNYVPDRSGQEEAAIIIGQNSVVADEVNINPREHKKVTITAWVKVPANAAGQRFLVSAGAANNWPALMINNGRLEAIAGRGIPGYGPLLIDTPLPPDQWVPVAGVWDFEARLVSLHQGSLPPKEFTGADMIESSLTNREYKRPGDASSQELPYIFIGAGDFNRFKRPANDIAIDDVCIFTRALSAEEIALPDCSAATAGSSTTSASAAGATVGSGTETTVSGADPAATTGPALAACSGHKDCETGTYCALDDTCHPEIHLPKGNY